MNGKKTEIRKQILKARNALLPELRRLWDQWILQKLIEYDQKNPCPVYLCYVSYKSEVSTKEFILWCLENDKSVFVPKVLSHDHFENILTDNYFESEKKSYVFGTSEEKPTEMEFYQITEWKELKKGYQGILEPEAFPERSFYRQFQKNVQSECINMTHMSEKKDCMLPKKQKTLPYFRMLLPGAVFDKSGNRIGYGSGFYDRWLAKWADIQHSSTEVTTVRKDSKCSYTWMLEKIGLAYQMQIVDKIPAEPFDQRVNLIITEKNVIDHIKEKHDDT